MKFTIIKTSNQILLNTEALETIAYLTLTTSNKVLKVFVVEDFLIKFPTESDLWISFVHKVIDSPKDISITIDNYNKQLTEVL
jgi:hypothetical protein